MLRIARAVRWTTIFMIGLYLSGIILWGIFLNWGDIPYQFYDWAEINMPRLASVQDALHKNVLPLHLVAPDPLRCGIGCTRYFSSVDVIVSPDLIFLKWLPLGSWVLLHIWLLYSAGFWGMLALQRRFKLSLPLFAIAYLLFFFNGHILSHLSIGHLTWGGYFLFPWLVYLVDRFIEGENSWAWVLKVSLLLFAIYLQGSFHQFVWSLIFLGFLAIVYFRRFFTVFAAMLFSCLVSAFRLVPPALSYNSFVRSYYGGYPDLAGVYIALTHWVTPADGKPFEHLASRLGYWEIDLFIGKVGVLFLLAAGLAWLAWQVKTRKIAWVLIPTGALFLLSLGDVFQLFRKIPIPLLDGERVTTRMISLALVFFIFFSIAALQKWLDRLGKWKWAVELALVPLAIYQAVVLVPRVLAWRVTEAARLFPFTAADLTLRTIANHADPIYFLALGGSLLFTVLMIVLLIWLAKKYPQKTVVH